MRTVLAACSVIVGICVGVMLGGCASGPKGWPSSIDGRSVRDGGVAWMYAAKGSSADGVAALTSGLAADFQRVVGRPPAKGVVIVTELGEAPAGVSSVQSGAADAIRDAAGQIGESALGRELSKHASDVTALASVGAWGRELRGATGVPEIVREQTPYVVSVPSSRAIETTFDGAADAVASVPDAPLAARLLIRSGLKMVKSEFIMTLRDMHRQTIWKAMVEGDTSLTAEQRGRLRGVISGSSGSP